MLNIARLVPPQQVIETGKGTYILLLYLENLTPIQIGKLGLFDFPSGWYVYVGSAFGAGGLRGRLNHHMRAVNSPHWHIDYLRKHAVLREIWYVCKSNVYEHQWAARLCAAIGGCIPVPRFGASDCCCTTHLIRFAEKPELAEFASQTRQLVD